MKRKTREAISRKRIVSTPISAKLIGQKIELLDPGGNKFTGLVLEVTESHISLEHKLKGFRMFPIHEIKFLGIKKQRKAGCGCKGKR